MDVLVLIGLTSIGVVFGMYLATWVLWVITGLAVVVATIMSVKFKEMETLLTLAFVGCATVVILAMWITHYRVSEATWVSEFFQFFLR